MKRSRNQRKRSATSEGPSLFPVDDVADDGGGTLAHAVERWPIPESWVWTKVGEIGDALPGLKRSPKNRPGLNSTKYLRAANITPDGLNLTDLLEMDFDAELREVYALRVGDIVLTEGSGSADQVGRSALWRGELPLCCIQNTLLRFRPIGFSSEYALIVFQHFAENGLFANLLRGIGIAHLGGERFSNLPFPLAPRAEQDRIVAEFGVQADRAKNALASFRSAKSKISRQRLAVINKELKVDSGGDPSATESKPLPKGWRRVRLGDVCEAVNGRAFKSSEWRPSGLPIIRIQNLRDPEAEFNYFDGEVEDRHRVGPGDLLFAWSGTPGSSFGAFVWQGSEGALNQHIFKLTADPSMANNGFLCYAINQRLDEYVGAAQGGGGLAHITRGQFLDSEVVLAPLSHQARIVEAIRRHLAGLDKQEKLIDQNIARTALLRQALLQSAVEGKLVPQSKKDDSAKALLAEIRADFGEYEQQLASRRRALREADMAKKQQPGSTLPKKDLHDVLKELGPLPPRELLRKAGYREENPGDVEEFYRLLHVAHKEKRIVTDSREADPELAKLKAVG